MKKVFSALGLFFWMQFSFAQDFSQSTLARIDQYMVKTRNEWGVPGMTVGIVYQGKLIFSKGYGTKEEGKDLTPDGNTLFAIASNSKAFTATMIAMLVQEGKLKWDDKVVDHLPYFRMEDARITNMVTVEDLLCHRVGLGTFSGDIIWHQSGLTAEEIIQRIQHLPGQFEFRDGFGYSNLMYITAGELIHKVTGKSWIQNVQERILTPLGMNRTIARIKDLEVKGNFATPHALVDGMNKPMHWVNWETVAATGGLISSVEDVSKWINFNLNKGIHGKDTLLKLKHFNKLWNLHNNYPVDYSKSAETGRTFSGYGLGWGVGDYYGHLKVGHTGGYDGMITAVDMLPADGVGVIVLTNGLRSPIRAVTQYIYDAFLGRPEKDWSKELLEANSKHEAEDKRVEIMTKSHRLNTKPTLANEAYTGTFRSAIYGEIVVTYEAGALKMRFAYTPDLTCTLRHWHNDVWEMVWDKPQAWFKLGTVGYVMDNNLTITGLDFMVPNNDIFFEELKPVKVK